MSTRLAFPVPPGAERTRCRSCGAIVVWIVTASGKRMTVNADTGESHFATCPEAKQWRRLR